MSAFRIVRLARATNQSIARVPTNLSSAILSRSLSSDYRDRGEEEKTRKKRRLFGLIAAAATTGAIGYKFLPDLIQNDEQSSKDDKTSKLPSYSRKEVAKHDSIENGVWITYKGSVYDITKFIEHHSGGSHTIILGAGGDVEPFWQTYTVHHAAEVQNLLKSFHIGYLSDDEVSQAESRTGDANPYDADPKRSPLLKVLSERPFNAETPSKLLVSTPLTPDAVFFVRNHLPVPEVDLADYRLSVYYGSDGDPDNLKIVGEFTLDELKTKFESYTVDSVIQCSGNRRSDLKKIKEIKGLDWKVGAIGNARWTGVRLIDLLNSLGVNLKDGSIRHVQLEGLDCDMSGQTYGASVSADYAFDPNKQVLLAYEMNGNPLSRDHGFPLRFVAPGVTGARNVKWLSKIILSDEESNSHWQRNDYKGFSPNVDLFNIDYTSAASIQEMPVQSAICDPIDGEEIKLKRLKSDVKPGKLSIPVRGYSYSGGGKMIVRVDLSLDKGKTWVTANLDDAPKNPNGTPNYTDRNKTGSWMRWSLDVDIPDELLESGGGSLEILCRAFDSAYNSQPERAETLWNVRGVVNNSWHKIKLNLIIEE